MPFDNPLPRPIPEGHRRLEDVGFASPQAAPSVDDDVLRVLIEARKLLSNEKRWAKGDYCVGDGFCALGAIGVREGHFTELHDRILIVLRDHLGVGRMVHKFNDDPRTTHADVLSLFDRAIAARRNEIGAGHE